MFRQLLTFLFACVLCWSVPASAGSFSIDPVRIQLSEARPSAVMRVENRGSAVVTVQLQAMRWSQSGNREQLDTSRELLATPQVFRLRPGQVQVVRIALLRPVDEQRELAYRLLLDEVPPPPAADFRGLQMALRISMPVFVQPRSPATADLAAMMVEHDGQRQLRLHNRGQAHLQLTGLNLLPETATSPADVADAAQLARAPDGVQALYAHDKTLYLLPGQQRELPLPSQSFTAAGQSLSLRAQTDSGAQHWPVTAVRH